MASRTALTTREKSPSVISVSGADTSLRIGPRRAWTRAKTSDTHSRDTSPPFTVTESSSAAARPIAAATTAHAISSRTSMEHSLSSPVRHADNIGPQGPKRGITRRG